MKRAAALVLIVLLGFGPVKSFGCSAFAVGTPNFMVMAKSYDWDYEKGLALINKRNVKKTALLADGSQPLSWVSKYGSLTYTQFGREFPVGGMNENGLAVETLWDYDSPGPAPQGRLPAVNEAQWVQYQLDTAKNLTEVIDNTKAMRVSKVFANVHYFVCDESGACATFEFDKDKVIITQGADLKVKALTNSQYRRSASYLKQYEGFGGKKPTPWSSIESQDRFVILAAQLSKFNNQSKVESAVSLGWDILKSVRQPEYSMWNMVHDLKGRVSRFRLVFNPDVLKEINLKSFDWSCKTPVKMLDLGSPDAGDVSSKFIDFDPALNRAQAWYSGEVLHLPAKLVDAVVAYPDTTHCLEQ